MLRFYGWLDAAGWKRACSYREYDQHLSAGHRAVVIRRVAHRFMSDESQTRRRRHVKPATVSLET
jgi:hypothetical protein